MRHTGAQGGRCRQHTGAPGSRCRPHTGAPGGRCTRHTGAQGGRCRWHTGAQGGRCRRHTGAPGGRCRRHTVAGAPRKLSVDLHSTPTACTHPAYRVDIACSTQAPRTRVPTRHRGQGPAGPPGTPLGVGLAADSRPPKATASRGLSPRTLPAPRGAPAMAVLTHTCVPVKPARPSVAPRPLPLLPGPSFRALDLELVPCPVKPEICASAAGERGHPGTTLRASLSAPPWPGFPLVPISPAVSTRECVTVTDPPPRPPACR